MKNYFRPLIILFLFAFSFNTHVFSQIGGDNTYEFLNLSNSARVAALGGNFLAVKDHDITLAPANPSLITSEMNNDLALSYVDYFSDINYGFVSYGRSFPKLGNYVATMQYINYGDFLWTDETGRELGEFTAGEFAFNLGWGRQLDSNFSIGANFKAIYSSFDEFNSFGLAVDVAGTYYNPESQLTLSLVARNIGSQLDPYYSNHTEPLPFEIALGLSKRLKHLPFRYSVLITHLEKWDLTFDDPFVDDEGIDPFTGEEKKKSGAADFADKAMRHVVLGGELLLSKNFSLRLGYNYHRRQELKIDTKASTLGFSWGFGIRVSKFHISYARSTYHLVGSPNYISITTNFSSF
ncbi:MAG: type IX secretion system protein PorQ [Bacteroidota bacterium]|nr:type IX secretion system protein PorQ [Bacteroidota bacterium]